MLRIDAPNSEFMKQKATNKLYMKPSGFKDILSSTSRLGRNILSALIVMVFTTSAVGQVKKGQRLMEEGRYSDAVRTLSRDFNYKKPDAATGILLAKSYYQLHEYSEAKDIMDLIGEAAIDDPDDMRFYADVLIATDDFSEAQLTLFKLLAKGNSDPETWLWLKKTSDLLEWDSVNTGSNVKEILGANTIFNEYAPYAAPDGSLWFINDGISVQSMFPVVYSDQNMHVFYKTQFKAIGSNKIDKPQILLKKRDYYYHDGPLNPWPGQNKYAISLRVLDVDYNSARMGIFFSPFEGKDDMVPFRFNEDYDTGHPTFTSDGSRMFFTSARPGGFGQMDIWYCDWIDGKWTAPRNMGPFINTPGNEVFPHYKEGKLYFSSDRRDIGYGGLDLYQADEATNFDKLYNLRAPINSPYDDFSISMIDEHHGYFASDRAGGYGGDDIYQLTLFLEQIHHDFRIAMILEDDMPPGTDVTITDSQGKVVQETKVLSNGHIEMEGLKSREVYLLEVLEKPVDEAALMGLLNDEGQIVKTFKQKFANTFEFVLLDPGYYELPKVENDDTSVLNYGLKGKVVTNESYDFSNSSVNVVDSKGSTIGTSPVTDEGDFEFIGLTMDEMYKLQTIGIEVDHELDIVGNSGALIQSIKPIGNNTFSYTRAAPTASWMNTADVVVPQVFAIQLGKDLGPEDVATLYDEKDKMLYRCDIDEDGFVELGNLTAGKAYRLQLEKTEIDKNDRLLILDGNGDTSQTVRPTGVNNYIFEYMMYDGYGNEHISASTAPVKKAKSEPVVFKGKIEGYTLPAGSMLLLTKTDGTIVDSIYPAENGAFTVRKIDDSATYVLKSADGQLAKASKLKVYSRANKELASVNLNEDDAFKFGPLKPAEVAQTEVKKSSVLKFTLTGVLTKPVAEPRIEKLTLLDADGKFLSESYTTEDNDFVFTGLTPANKFIIQTQVDDAYSTISVGRSINKDSVIAPIQADGSFIIDFNKKKVPERSETKDMDEDSNVLEAGSTFDLPSVFYDFNSYGLLPKSKESLDLLAELLSDMPQIRIEIQAHTDSRGPKTYNLTLSQKRAESVVNYLISKGVDKSRLQSKGFGEEQLSNKCTDGVRCAEAQHALNRRTTFVIL